MADTERLTGDQVAEAGLADWRPMLNTLRSRFTSGDFLSGLDLVTRIATAAEEMNHHPDLDLRYPHVDVTLTSHDVGGVTERDLRLARRISEIAADLGVSADPRSRQTVEISLDTWASDDIRPFWAAVLGAEEREQGNDVVEGSGQVPAMWFQDTDRHDEPRQRFHLDVWVAPDAAAGRIEAALAAGGVLVSDEEAPSFVVLADVQGNKACICTSADRG